MVKNYLQAMMDALDADWQRIWFWRPGRRYGLTVGFCFVVCLIYFFCFCSVEKVKVLSSFDVLLTVTRQFDFQSTTHCHHI